MRIEQFQDPFRDPVVYPKDPWASSPLDDRSNPWRSMDTVPRWAEWVEVKLADQTVHTAHHACDLSGEEQPPFKGWYVKCGNYFSEIKTPYAWRPIKSRATAERG